MLYCPTGFNVAKWKNHKSVIDHVVIVLVVVVVIITVPARVTIARGGLGAEHSIIPQAIGPNKSLL